MVYAQEETCIIANSCVRTDAEKEAGVPCPNPQYINTPSVTPYAPYTNQGTDNPSFAQNLATACPFLDPDSPLCCDDDGAQIMAYNYQALDAVFDGDSTVCASNLKAMWCEYACNPTKRDWLTVTGEVTQELSDGPHVFEEITFDMNEDYACDLFQSCAKVSLIAESGIQSSIAFLDFLGVNGQNQSYTIITFDLNEDEKSFDFTAYPCDTPIPEGGTIFDYPAENVTCSYCDAACEAPPVDGTIGFLDGFNNKLVGGCYGGFIAFTIIYQIFLCYKKKKRQETTHATYESSGMMGNNINKSHNSMLTSRDESRADD